MDLSRGITLDTAVADLQKIKDTHPQLGKNDKLSIYGYVHSHGLLFEADMSLVSAEGKRWIAMAYDDLLTQSDKADWVEAGASGTELRLTCGETGATHIVIKTPPFSKRPRALWDMRCALQNFDTRPRPAWELEMDAEIEAELAMEKAAREVGKPVPKNKKKIPEIEAPPTDHDYSRHDMPPRDTWHPSNLYIFPGILSDVPVPSGNTWQQHLKNTDALFDLFLEPFAKREMPSASHFDRVAAATQACLSYRPHHDPIFRKFHGFGFGGS